MTAEKETIGGLPISLPGLPIAYPKVVSHKDWKRLEG